MRKFKGFLSGFAVVLLTTLCPATIFAWGPTGHRVVGRIAEHHVSPETAQAITCLIGPETLAQVATWPDDIRSDPAWKRADPWHYVSIEDGQTYETSTKAAGGDVIEAIGRFTATLRDPAASRDAKAEALRFLVHLVGDIHQPLHVGRAADAGGNLVKLTWFGAPSNLHSVWDSEMIDHQKLSFSELAEFLDHPTRQQVRDWQQGGALDWAAESQALRPQVYAIPDDSKLSWDYEWKTLPIVKQRLLQAGVRLAGLLDEIFVPLVTAQPTPP